MKYIITVIKITKTKKAEQKIHAIISHWQTLVRWFYNDNDDACDVQ